MGKKTFFVCEFLSLAIDADGVYIETFKKGFPIGQLNDVLSRHPEINITHFAKLSNAIINAPQPPQKIGALKERIVINITDDALKAYVTYNLPVEELEMKNRDKLIKETMEQLSKHGIVFGIFNDLFFSEILSGKPYLIAEGIPAVDGSDSIIRTYEIKEPKPLVSKDGKVNFYELQLINKVKAGEWLGERIEATLGIPGKTVTGDVIKPAKGKNYPLSYDNNTVVEIYEGQKTTLYSRINGAVIYADGKIAVSDYLQIDGDVDFKTGNIKFDGFVTINGTVADGFYVEATKDIEINSPYGIGNVKGILSTNGSIYIKGGISSRDKAEIKASKNIFTKFVDNAVLSCGGSMHIGYYCKNSIINANDIVIDSPNGHIIGGNVSAEVRVLAPVIGSEIERRTIIEVRGFNRALLTKQLDEIINRINYLKCEQQMLKQKLSTYHGHSQVDDLNLKEYNMIFEKIFEIKDEINHLEEKRKLLASNLKAKGEGEICISKKAYPNCCLRIMGNTIELASQTLATTYFIQNGEIKQI